MAERRIRLTFTDLTGTRHADVTLVSNLTGEQVIDRLIQSSFLAGLDPGQVYTLQIKRTAVAVQPNQTLESAGVQEGDVLIAGVMTRGGAARMSHCHGLHNNLIDVHIRV